VGGFVLVLSCGRSFSRVGLVGGGYFDGFLQPKAAPQRLRPEKERSAKQNLESELGKR